MFAFQRWVFCVFVPQKSQNSVKSLLFNQMSVQRDESLTMKTSRRSVYSRQKILTYLKFLSELITFYEFESKKTFLHKRVVPPFFWKQCMNTLKRIDNIGMGLTYTWIHELHRYFRSLLKIRRTCHNNKPGSR